VDIEDVSVRFIGNTAIVHNTSTRIRGGWQRSLKSLRRHRGLRATSRCVDPGIDVLYTTRHAVARRAGQKGSRPSWPATWTHWIDTSLHTRHSTWTGRWSSECWQGGPLTRRLAGAGRGPGRCFPDVTRSKRTLVAPNAWHLPVTRIVV
jgi:hypothetical protein